MQRSFHVDDANRADTPKCALCYALQNEYTVVSLSFEELSKDNFAKEKLC